MTADLSLLHPDILPLCNQLMTDLAAKGFSAKVTTTYRAPAVEDALSSAVTSVTAKTSKHCTTLSDGTPAAKAFDISCFDADGNYITNGDDESYSAAGALWQSYAAENPSLGLIWGGTWRVPHDPDHFQIA